MADDENYLFPKSILKAEDYDKHNNLSKHLDNRSVSEENLDTSYQNLDHYQYPSTSSGSMYLVDSVSPFRRASNTPSHLQKKKVEFAKQPNEVVDEVITRNNNFKQHESIEEPLSSSSFGKISTMRSKNQYQKTHQRFQDEELFLKFEQSFKVNYNA